ncbi:hypothetical protein [Pseudomonas paeninsulae]|nr:hypothetical protein [Pseudomonas sp. IT1137]
MREKLAGWISLSMQEDRQMDRAFFLKTFNGNGSFTYDRFGSTPVIRDR